MTPANLATAVYLLGMLATFAVKVRDVPEVIAEAKKSDRVTPYFSPRQITVIAIIVAFGFLVVWPLWVWSLFRSEKEGDDAKGT